MTFGGLGLFVLYTEEEEEKEGREKKKPRPLQFADITMVIRSVQVYSPKRRDGWEAGADADVSAKYVDVSSDVDACIDDDGKIMMTMTITVAMMMTMTMTIEHFQGFEKVSFILMYFQ